jgi:hypothetical protein
MHSFSVSVPPVSIASSQSVSPACVAASTLISFSVDEWAVADIEKRAQFHQLFYEWKGQAPYVLVIMLVLLSMVPFGLYKMFKTDVLAQIKLLPSLVAHHVYGSINCLSMLVLLACIGCAVKPLEDTIAASNLPLEIATQAAYKLRNWHLFVLALNCLMISLPILKHNALARAQLDADTDAKKTE